MDIAILVLSIISVFIFSENYFLKKKIIRSREEHEENDVEKKLTEFSIRQLKIKNDVESRSLDELVNRKRD